MRTTFYEADPFSGRKSKPITSIESDYRFEKGDEFIVSGTEDQRLRVTSVRLRIDGTTISRDILVLKL